MFSSTEKGEEDPYGDFEIFIPLIADDADQAGFRIHNKPGGESHRVYITGQDRRPNATAVRGRLYHVVHGVISNTNKTPATLIVFEWVFVPGTKNKRFKEIDIIITFAAYGRRPGMLPHEELEEFTPAVMAIAPDLPIESYHSGIDVTKQTSRSIALSGGLQGVSLSPSLSDSSTETLHRTDYRFITGHQAFRNRTYGEANSVQWKLRENMSQQSGTQKAVRTAVLLQREQGDYGQFLATVEISTDISLMHNMAERLRKAVGSIPVDDPIYFDPKSVQNVENGAAVLFGNRSTGDRESPCNAQELGREDLTKFLIADDAKQHNNSFGAT